MFSKNIIFIILDNRIKVIDTIIPLLIQLDKSKVEIYFYVPNKKIYDFLKRNIFLYDALINIGKIVYFSKSKNINQKTNINFFNFLFIYSFRFFFKILVNKFDIIYFTKFIGKRKLLSIFGYNLFYCENDPYGNTKFIEKIKFIEKGIEPAPYFHSKENLILLSKDYYNLKYNKNNNKLKFWTFKNLKKNKIWVNYVLEHSQNYLIKEFKKHDLNYSKNINTILLGVFEKDFGWCKEKNIMPILLRDVLQSLIEIDPETPIFLKPYDLTNITKLNEILSEFKFEKFVISYLHPMILATHSNVAIANSSTAALGDLKIFNVPTIEYTHYSKDVLNYTNNKSIRPDWTSIFINHDKEKLKNALNHILKNKYEDPMSKFQSKNIDELSNNEIIKRLNGFKKTKSLKYSELINYFD